MALKKTRTMCTTCHARCGVIVYSDEDNKIIKVEGDPDNPKSAGVICGAGMSQREIHNNTEGRILYPMKRVGERGSGEWERITWDEAYELITEKFMDMKEKYGAESVIFAQGTGRDIAAYITRLCWSFGSPNYTGLLSGQACYLPRIAGMAATTGHPWIPDAAQQFPERYDHPDYEVPEVMFVWGNYPLKSNIEGFYGHWVIDLMKRGMKLVTVDPKVTWLASKSELHLRVRPGTDTAFLLAVAYEMVRLDEERGDIIDWGFVNERTVGFTPETMPADATTDENFRDYLLGAYDNTPKTPEWATEICGTPVEDITWYAEMAGKNNAVMFLHSYAASRYLGAENLSQAFMTVSALGGHFGKSGHGSAAIYTWDAGDSGYRLIQHVGGDYGYVDNLVGSPAATGPNRNIEGNSWWSTLADGKYLSSSEGPYDLGSSDVVGDPTKLRANTPVYHEAREMPVNPRLLVQTNSNFMQTRGNLSTAIKVMRAADTCVSFEIKFSLTAQFADIILPVCTHWEGNDDESWGELSWPSPFGDGNGQKQRKDALLAWKPLVKPMYEAREEKRVFREIIERMGYNPDDAYPKSNYDQWLGYFLGMRVLNEDATKWEPVITWTEADNEKYHASYPAQEGKVAFDQFMADGSYVVERSEGDPRNYVGYRDDKLGIGEDGESVVVADTAWPRPSVSGKLEVYCQYKADNVNRIGLNDEPIKPYANYFVPRRGYQETFANWEVKEKGAYPLQAYTPHYMRRAHTCYDNMTWTQEAFRNPVFMSVEDAEARGIKAGDTVRCFNDFGSMLRIAQPMQGYMPGVVGIPHGVHSVFDESDPENIIDRGGSEQMLSDGLQSNYFPQVDGYNSLLIEIEKYDGEPLVEDFERGPFLAAGIDAEGTAAYMVPGADNGQEA